MVLMIGCMQPGFGTSHGGRRCNKDPPAWTPHDSVPFRQRSQDFLTWSILASDLEHSQQVAAIIVQLGGAARNVARHFSFEDMIQGGIVNGQQVDPVTFLLTHLATHFAPLGEETRLQAMTALMQFQRQPAEQTDSLISRFLTRRFRKGNP
jgi:hypothetical protein